MAGFEVEVRIVLEDFDGNDEDAYQHVADIMDKVPLPKGTSYAMLEDCVMDVTEAMEILARKQ